MISGILDGTDFPNPTRPDTFRDDYLLVGVLPGQQVSISYDSAFDAFLQLVNADTGGVIAFDDDGGPGLDSFLSFTVQAGLDYIVRATSFRADATGGYTLTNNVGTLIPGTTTNPDLLTTGVLDNSDPLDPGGSGSFTDDFFLTGILPGQQVTLNYGSSDFDTLIELVDANTGQVLASDDDSGPGLDSQLSFIAQPDVDYIARARSFSPGVEGLYTLDVLTSPTVSGTLDSTDFPNPTRSGRFRDDYLLTGVFPGQQVSIGYSADFDAFLQLIDADTGAVIAADDDGGFGVDSFLSFTAEVGVDYIVRATAFSANATGAYALTSSLGSLIPGTTTNPNLLTTGVLDNTDFLDPSGSGSFTDDFLLTGILPGQQVTLSYGSNDFDTVIELVDVHTGEVIASDDDSGPGLDSQLTFVAQPGIDYIARARSFAAGQEGVYTLDVDTSFSIGGQLSNTDLIVSSRPGRFLDDYELLGVDAGQSITLDLVSADGVDTFLQLIDLNTGLAIAADDDGGAGLNAQLTFTAIPGVDYGVRATSFAPGETGTYALTTSSGTFSSIAPSSLILNDPFEGGPIEVQTLDGSGNNLDATQLGRAETPLLDIAPLDYGNGFSTPAGQGRPNPRLISNTLSAQNGDTPEPRGLTNFIWAWGQFLDHDLSLTPENEDVSIDIPVPFGDPDFDPQGTGIARIALNDSVIVPGTGTTPDNPRRLPNEITHWIDGSSVYGSDEERGDFLRAFSGGRLNVSSGDLLPFGNADLSNDNPTNQDPEDLFAAGDVRANENAVLTSLHTLFVREHNRLADELAQAHPTWSDEQIFQRARRINIAQLQQITFNEYLPTLLGTELPDYEGYNSNIDARIDRTFSSAAFRLGHTQLSSLIPRLTPDGATIAEGNLTLSEVFFPGNSVLEEANIDPILRGIASSLSQRVDNQLIDDVRNLLFGPGPAAGRDLSAINIQRGRFNGLADYNTVRESFGLDAVTSFADITADVGRQLALADLYGSVNNIDAFVGFLAEDALPGSSLGETLNTLLVEQFVRLRDGDRFYYENLLTAAEVAEIEETQLSDIIRRNTDTVVIQDNAFTLINSGTAADETLNGGLGQDVISGLDGDDVINGFAGSDRLRGNSGDDTLIGGDGSDTLRGGTGQDTLIGVDPQSGLPGAGEIDILTGGQGPDQFVIGDAVSSFYIDAGGSDGFALITDFGGGDRVRLSGSASDYALGSVAVNPRPAESAQGTGIFLGGTDLVAVLQNQTLSGFDDRFIFV